MLAAARPSSIRQMKKLRVEQLEQRLALTVPLLGGFSSAVEYDGNSHFDALVSDPNIHAMFSLRNQSEINTLTQSQGQLRDQPDGNNPQVQFDATMNGAKVTIPADTGSLPTPWQLRPRYPAIDKTSGEDEVSIQWEARFGSDFLDVTTGGLQNYKAFQIAKRTQGDARRIELQTRVSYTDNTAVAIPTVRVYWYVTAGGDGNKNPLRTDGGNHYNWQPGGDTYATNMINDYGADDHLRGDPLSNAFVIRPDKWIRFTASLTFTGGVQRLRLWMSDEDTPPTLVIADPDDPTLGFLTDWPQAQEHPPGSGIISDLSGSDEFWVEFNTSQQRTGPELEAWVRNIVVYRNGPPPPLALDDTASVTEDTPPNPVSGNVLTNDGNADNDPVTVSQVNGSAANVGNSVNGSYGTLILQSDGNYSYTLDNANAAVDALLTGEVLADSFSYTVSDGQTIDTAALDVTIHGIGLGVTSVRAPAPTDVHVVFTEPVEMSSAEDIQNYSIVGGATVLAANLEADGRTVTLTTPSLAEDQTYTLSVSNIVGLSGRALSPAQVDFVIDPRLITFQEGVETTISGVGTGAIYTGTIDADPAGGNPTSPRNRSLLNLDGNPPVHGLTAFIDLFGEGPGQIPTAATITKATLALSVSNQGNALQIHRLLGAFDEATVTWNDLMLNGNTEPGLQGDGVEATPVLRTFSASSEIDVTEDLQLWISGEAENFGWGFTPTGSNGVDWHSSESPSISNRPKLMVEYRNGPPPSGNFAPNALDDTASVTEDTPPNPVSGNVLTNDGDADNDPVTVSQVNGSADNVGDSVNGSYGTLILQSDGNYSYTLDNANAAVDALLTGEMLTDSFSYTISDGQTIDTAALDVTIHGVGLGVTSVRAPDPTDVHVVFSEPVEMSSAEDIQNYSIVGGATVLAANLEADGRTVTLTTSSLAEDQTYTLSVSNIVGLSGRALSPAQVDFVIDPRLITFQQGVETTIRGVGTGAIYTGTIDADPAGGNPTSPRNRSSLNLDGSSGGAPVHGLTAFNDLFGEGPGQIPTAATITKATLAFGVFNQGDALQIHRLLGAFNQATVTWNDLMLNGNTEPGLQGDGVEATPVLRTFSASSEIDVTEDLQLWISGEAENFGWGFTPTGSNGVDWHSSESPSISDRPKLTVEYLVPSIEPLLPGDIDGNGSVDFEDFLIISANFGMMVDPTGTSGDINGNGIVDFSDFLVLSRNFGQSAAPVVAAVDAALVDLTGQ